MSTIKVTNVSHPSAVDPAIELDAAGKLWLAGGKVLQVVRATDSTDHTTTSTSYADVTGLSVTITPQKSDSNLVIIANVGAQTDAASCFCDLLITDSSNTSLSGTDRHQLGGGTNIIAQQTLFGYVAAVSTAARTYKMRFRKAGGGGTTATVRNGTVVGQMYAIEVSA
jgi:hypothetical protein